MIIFDKEAQQFCLNDEEAFMAVPLSYVGNNEKISITVYPVFEKEAEIFLEAFQGKYFSDEAIEYAKAHFSGLLFEKGYKFESFSDSFLFTYTVKNVSRNWILPNTELLCKRHLDYECPIDCELPCMLENYTTFVTVADGKIVSYASANQEDGRLQIGVETAQPYRRQGFGASNIAALCDYLKDSPLPLTYSAECGNLPSQRLIEKLGGILSDKLYCMVMCRY